MYESFMVKKEKIKNNIELLDVGGRIILKNP
jgi:hypothetical protein